MSGLAEKDNNNTISRAEESVAVENIEKIENTGNTGSAGNAGNDNVVNGPVNSENADSSDEGSGGVFRHMGKRLSEGTYRTLFGIGLLLIISAKAVFDFNGLRGFVSNAGKMIVSILGYLLVGFIIAYILNVYVDWLTAHPLKKIKSPKRKRAVGIIIAYITLTAVVAFLIGTAFEDRPGRLIHDPQRIGPADAAGVRIGLLPFHHPFRLRIISGTAAIAH